MRILREDMKIVVAKTSDQAQSVTHQVAQLGTMQLLRIDEFSVFKFLLLT